ncbi:MAG: hypothetical protein HY720_07875 [Planctomycetes bacterium]|nr:hypothetical protein [Planctomycetota bacterium]
MDIPRFAVRGRASALRPELLAPLLAGLFLAGCTATRFTDLGPGEEVVSEETVLETKDELREVELAAAFSEGYLVDATANGVFQVRDRVEALVAPAPSQKVSVASWETGYHVLVWTLGLPFLAPLWAYGGGYYTLDMDAIRGLDVPPGTYDFHPDQISPEVVVTVEGVSFPPSKQVRFVDREPRTIPLAGATVEGVWLAAGANPVRGTTDEAGHVLLDLGRPPAGAPAGVRALVTLEKDGRRAGVELPVAETAREEVRQARLEFESQEWSARMREALDSFERDAAEFAGHLRSRTPHLDTVRAGLGRWRMWALRTGSELAGLDPSARGEWEERLGAFVSEVDTAQAALGQRDLPGTLAAVQRAADRLR